MIEILILTAALGCTEVTEIPVVAIVAAPVRVLERKPLRTVYRTVRDRKPVGRLLSAVAARKPARRALGRVADRFRERPRVRTVRSFVTGH